MEIINFLMSLVSSGSTIIYGILAAGSAVLAAWALGKREGSREQQHKARIEQLERNYDTVVAREKTEDTVRDMSSDELERLRQQYERPDDEGDVRRVGVDSDEQERRPDSKNA